MAGLGVNIDHVATIRQARKTIEPDPVWAAAQAELAGADCITFHLRKDRRHINDRDARLLAASVGVKLNMEMSLDPEIVAIALELRPDQATLVPENRQELTTEGGLDAAACAKRLAEVTKALREAGVLVSAFVDPIAPQIHAAAAAGCQAIELHTGTYANACLASPRRASAGGAHVSEATHVHAASAQEALEQIRAGLQEGLAAGLIVHGGHGLTYSNVTPVAALKGFTEFNIGHSIISRAVFAGLGAAVAEMKRLIVAADS
ncbi:MAG: pyridoxine 5'-phosphate synthase [Planctomycetaceae bacterium]|nr:pyridoxine 5'-phosphate synthase [Planctomycetaceae bacterium]